MKREPTLSAAVIGVDSANGGELVRLLDGHDGIALKFLGTARAAGVTLERAHPHLSDGDRLLYPADINLMPDVDIVFSDVAEGDAWKLARDLLDRGVKVVDLGHEFRYDSRERYQAARRRKHPAGGWSWQYGLAETSVDEIARSESVAVPSAVAAAVALVAGPPLNEGLIEADPLFVEAAISPEDAHSIPIEIEQALEIETGAHPRVVLRSHTLVGRVAQAIVTVRSVATSRNEIVESLADAYRASQLVSLVESAVERGSPGSARCLVTVDLDERTGFATLGALYDSFLVGGPGLAVRCANLMLGLEPLAGVPLAGLTNP